MTLSDGAITAVVALFGVLLGAAISLLINYVNRKDQIAQRTEARQQWYDQFRIPRQIDAFSSLYASLSQLHDNIANLSWQTPNSATRNEVDSIAGAITNAANTYALAYVYLDDEERTLFQNYLNHASWMVAPYRLVQLDKGINSPNPHFGEKISPTLMNEERDMYQQMTASLQKQLKAISI